MHGTMKFWFATAAVLVLAGLILFAAVMTANRWDFTVLDTVRYETSTHLVDGGFTGIAVVTDTADVVFVPSGDGACSVVCQEEEHRKHTVSVQDGTLTIEVVNEKRWYEYIGFHFGRTRITVSLPEEEYAALTVRTGTGDVEIPADFRFGDIDVTGTTCDVVCRASASGTVRVKLSTGDVRAEGLSAGTMEISVTTGDVTVDSVTCEGGVTITTSTGDSELNGVNCGRLTASASTGDVGLTDVIVSGGMEIVTGTGDVRFDRCDAEEILVRTGTGSVRGSLLSEKVFITETGTGRVDVPKTVTGGKCEITTNTGNIRITVE